MRNNSSTPDSLTNPTKDAFDSSGTTSAQVSAELTQSTAAS